MKTLWISHRGESYDAPPNTIPAFALSQERRTHGMECDIHFTADGKVVCIHDDNTSRVADETVLIHEKTFEELQQVDVWDHKEGYKGTRIPLFTDTIKYLGDDRIYYVEIKGGDLKLVPELLKIIAESGKPKEQFVMISFWDEVVKLYKEMAPDHKAYLLTGGDPAVEIEELIARLKNCHADGIDIGCIGKNIDQAYVDRVHAEGFEFTVWTIDDPETAEKFLGFGVEAITSNRAAYLMDMFNGK